MNHEIDVSLTMTEEQHADLFLGLFPGDGLEAVALLLCGRRNGKDRHRLVVKEVHLLPNDAYLKRSPSRAMWNVDSLLPILDKAEAKGLSVVKVHSHPNGYSQFSKWDDESDGKLFPCLKNADAGIIHASAVMLPGGNMFGRYYGGGQFFPLERISVVGHDLNIWLGKDSVAPIQAFAASHAQAFGAGTTAILGQLTIAIIGCSGTGSIIAEALARLGAKRIILVDPDIIEPRNVNRIVNSRMLHVSRTKVSVIAQAIRNMGLGTEVIEFSSDLAQRDAMLAVAGSDVVFGCVDSHRGRYILNRLATFYTLPYFDIGVRLDAAGGGVGDIRQITGCISYLLPGMSSLLSREKISMDRVKAEGLMTDDPTAYTQQVKDGYIRGAQESRPAVISVNGFASNLAVNDFLARIHTYREMPNSDIAEIEFCLSGLEMFTEGEANLAQDEGLKAFVGAGDIEPLLGLPGLIK